MATGYVLYNTRAGMKADAENIKNLETMLQGELKFIEIEKIKDYKVFVSGLEGEDYIVLCGGDGTLNCFANHMEGIDYAGQILYYPNGTGNDFAHEMGKAKACEPFAVNEYLKDLPWVEVKGKKYRFLNGVGYGIDGYCCEVGDEQKKTSDKPVNYTAIAIKGLLFHYKPTNATITVDGVQHTYKKVWLAPTMYGKYYGGGMIPTPGQVRGEDSLSTMVYYGVGKLRALMVFPSIFKGEHVKQTKMVEILNGQNITVEFDRPTALQIDGETILGVSSYTASVK